MSNVSAFGSEATDKEESYTRTDSGNLLDSLNNDEGFQEQRKKGNRVVFRDSDLTETFEDVDLWVTGKNKYSFYKHFYSFCYLFVKTLKKPLKI